MRVASLNELLLGLNHWKCRFGRLYRGRCSRTYLQEPRNESCVSWCRSCSPASPRSTQTCRQIVCPSLQFRIHPCHLVHLIFQSETNHLTPPNSASNDFWSQTYRKAFNQQKMTQELSILTGCSAGATESFVVCYVLIPIFTALYSSNDSDRCTLVWGRSYPSN